MDLLARKIDALAQRFNSLRTPPSGSLLEGSSGAKFEVEASCEICGIQGHATFDTLLSREWSIPMLCKISTHAHHHKTTPTQTHITLAGEIILISPTAITTHCHPIPLILNPLVFNIRHPTTHSPNNRLHNLSPTWRTLWSTL